MNTYFKPGSLVNLKENRNEIFQLANINSNMAECRRINQQGMIERVFFYVKLLERASDHISCDYQLRTIQLKYVTTMLKKRIKE